MNLDELTDSLVDQIYEQASNSKGKANLCFQILDAKEGVNLEMFSRNTMVEVSNEFIEFLEKNDIEFAVS